VASAVATALAKPPAAPYDIVFLDPPYPLGEEALAADLALLVDNGWLVPGALVVVERSARSPEPTWPGGFEDVRSRKYGESTLWYGHAGS
jgi:16S rRNA (guanine966-N2)-methyltransferase